MNFKFLTRHKNQRGRREWFFSRKIHRWSDHMEPIVLWPIYPLIDQSANKIVLCKRWRNRANPFKMPQFFRKFTKWIVFDKLKNNKSIFCFDQPFWKYNQILRCNIIHIHNSKLPSWLKYIFRLKNMYRVQKYNCHQQNESFLIKSKIKVLLFLFRSTNIIDKNFSWIFTARIT